MRKGELAANLLVLWALPLALLGPVAARIVGSSPKMFLFMAPVLGVAGFSLIFKAKLPMFRKGHLFSFGSKGMTRHDRRGYRIGYAFLIVALFILAGFALQPLPAPPSQHPSRPSSEQ